MTKAQHTPGPWEHDGTGMVYGQAEDETGGSTFVADVVLDGAREWMDDTEKANANLIAAAPELLTESYRNLEIMQSCLKIMKLFHKESIQKDILESQIKATRAAIAKATGE